MYSSKLSIDRCDMQISNKQIKLARISLGWTQPELAEHVGCSKDTIVNLETGKSKQPNPAIVDKAVEVLRAGGIEFLEGNGIRERQNSTRKYEGVEGFRSFMDDVYETSKAFGGDLCLFNTQPMLWIKHLGEDWYNMHSKRMAALGDKINIRIAICEDDTSFILSAASYRWIPKDKWKERMFYAYGPKLAFLHFHEDSIDILVFNEAELADSFRIMYDVVWEHETIPVKMDQE